jgi:hypothetical protein
LNNAELEDIEEIMLTEFATERLIRELTTRAALMPPADKAVAAGQVEALLELRNDACRFDGHNPRAAQLIASATSGTVGGGGVWFQLWKNTRELLCERVEAARAKRDGIKLMLPQTTVFADQVVEGELLDHGTDCGLAEKASRSGFTAPVDQPVVVEDAVLLPEDDGRTMLQTNGDGDEDVPVIPGVDDAWAKESMQLGGSTPKRSEAHRTNVAQTPEAEGGLMASVKDGAAGTQISEKKVLVFP